MPKHLLVVAHPIFSNSKIMITISKFEKGLKPGDNVLKIFWQNRMRGLTDLVLTCFSDTSVPGFLITPLHSLY